MGMRVGGAASSAAMSAWQSRRQDFGGLAAAIKGGDLSAAQAAFAKLAGTTGTAASAAATSGTAATTGTSTTGTTTDNSPLSAVGQALSSGDIKGAQQALANLFASGAGGHHHHHHGGQAAASTPAPQALPAGTTVSLMA